MARFILLSYFFGLMFITAQAETDNQIPILANDVPAALPKSSIQVSIDDIISSQKGTNSKCCPIGTEYNGQTCVFTTSTGACPADTDLKESLCVSKVSPSCSTGEILVGEACKSKKKPVCPADSRFDGIKCTSTRLAFCENDDFQFDGRSCVFANGKQCLSGFTLEGEDWCVSKQPLACDPADKLEAGSCVHTEDPKCTGNLQADGTCSTEVDATCPDTYVLAGQVCTKTEQPTLSTSSTPKCKTGLFNGKTCEDPNSEPICFSGATFQSGQGCVVEPFCGRDEVLYTSSTDAKCCATSDPRCATGEQPLCPGGYSFLQKNCVADEPPFCPGQSILSPEKDACVVKGELPTCDSGTFDAVSKKCVTTAKCPDKYNLSNGVCTITTAPTCSGNVTPNAQGKCASSSVPACASDATITGGKCITKKPLACPPSTNLDQGFCVKKTPSACPATTTWDPVTSYCVSVNPPRCDPGFTYDGENCNPTQSTPICPTGTLVNGDCEISRTPTCPAGSVYQNKQCIVPGIVPPPGCPIGTTLDLTLKRCLSSSQPVCSAGTVLKRGDCVSAKPTCAQGTLNGNVCVTVIVSQPNCASGEVLKDGECVKSRAACPPGFVAQGSACVTEVKCAAGTAFDGTNCISGTGCYDMHYCPPVKGNP